MTFQEVYPFFKDGSKIQRLSNVNSLSEKIYQNTERCTYCFTEIPVRDILADDWMVIHSTFNIVINLLMTKQCRKIFRFEDRDDLEKHIYYLNNESRIVKGLGTSHPHTYKFTEEDVLARDWCFTA